MKINCTATVFHSPSRGVEDQLTIVWRPVLSAAVLLDGKEVEL